MDRKTKNNIIRAILDGSGIADDDLKQEFLDKYIDKDIRLKDIERNLDYFIKKDKKKKKKNKTVEQDFNLPLVDKIKYSIYKYNELSIRTKEEIDIKLLDEKTYGTNGVRHVLVNDKDRAYLKTSKEKYVDDIDVSISQFAKIFDIGIADIYRIEDSNGGIGILSYDIRKDDSKDYISLYDAYHDYYSKYKNGYIINLNWVMELLSLPNSSKDNPLIREDHIRIVIDMALNILKDQLNVDEFHIKELRKQYLNILLFDYVTNQSDRSLNNINLVRDGDNISFADLYDNGCVYNEAIGNNNICLLDHICDRDSLIKAIFKYYYSDIENSVKKYLNKKDYIERIDDILKNNLSEDNYKWYFNKINKNIDKVIDLYNNHNEQEDIVVSDAVPVDLSLQYGYVKTFSLLLSSLLALLFIVIIIQFFI